MAVGIAGAEGASARDTGTANYTLPMVLMVSLYFSIGFITALNDILVPHFKDLFHLTNVLALLVQFCFFGAYFVMSIPSGWVVSRIGYKAGIIAALCTMACGLFIFVPASIVILYPVFLFGLFVVGSGLALLQVAINPYVGALGKPETAATRISICGFFNSLATNRAPKIGAALIFVAAGATTAELARSVRMPYVALGCFTLFLALVTAFIPLPVVLGNEPAAEAGAAQGHAWSFRHLRLGGFAIFTYVGAEVAIGSIMINFLGQPSMGGLSHVAAATYVSYYWGAAMIGRLIGSFALPYIRTERALAAVSAAALVCISATILAHGPVALWATVSCGLFNSVMWPCIFPLSVKGLGKLTSQGSGILVMMVVGGAVIPEIQGLLADKFGYQHSFVIVLLCYAYIVYFAVSGYRIRQPRFASLPDFVPPVEPI
jgi:FHS family L-fucose permease-like MFS transporter